MRMPPRTYRAAAALPGLMPSPEAPSMMLSPAAAATAAAAAAPFSTIASSSAVEAAALTQRDHLASLASGGRTVR